MASIPKDPFLRGMFYAYEDMDCANTGGTFWIVYAAGADGTIGDWKPGLVGGKSAPAYNPSNGLTSNGDIWKAHLLKTSYLHQRIGLFDTFF